MSQKATASKTTDSKSSALPARVGRTEVHSQILPQGQLLQLHKQFGNRAVQRMHESGVLQAKLKIGQPGDKYEQEADRVADRVMSMPESNLSRQEDEEEVQGKPVAGQITPLVQRQSEEEEEIKKQPEEEEEPVQTKLLQRQSEDEEEVQKQPEEEEESVQSKGSRESSPDMSLSVESGIKSIRGGGQPLSESSSAFFEPRFGADFSGVKIHTDSRANHLARSINAKAFTIGRDVAFGTGQYSPETSKGKQLLAHELTHVVQQHGVSHSQRGKKIFKVSQAFDTIQRFAFINENQVDQKTKGLTPGMKTKAADSLVRNYKSMKEFKKHAAKQTDYLGNLAGKVKTGTWMRFNPSGINVLGEYHTQVEFSAVAPSVGTKNFIYEQFSSDIMEKGSYLKAAYEKVNQLEFKKLGIEKELDKKKFGSESLFPKMGFALTWAIPYFEKRAPIAKLKSGMDFLGKPKYLGKPIQRYLTIAWGLSKDNLRLVKMMKAVSVWGAAQASSLVASVKSILGGAAAKLVKFILKVVAWVVGVVMQILPKKAQLATVHDSVKAKLDPFINSLQVDGYIGDELVKPKNAGLFPPLAKFSKALSEAMVERAATEKSSRLSQAERKKFLTAKTTSEAEKKKLFGQWRNHYFEDEVKAAAKRGVRYAGMGKAHLDYLKKVGLPSNAHPYNMVNIDINRFEALTKKLAKKAKTP